MRVSVRLSVTLSVSSPLSRFHGARFWPIFAALLATNRRILWDECSTSGCIWGCRSVRRGAESRAIPLGLSVRVVPHVWPAEPTVERDLACAERVVAPNKTRTSLGKGVNEPAGASRAGCKGSASTSIHCSFSTTQRRRHVAVRRRPASFGRLPV